MYSYLSRLFQQADIRLLADAGDSRNRQVCHWVNRQSLEGGYFLSSHDLEASLVLMRLEPNLDHVEAPAPLLRDESVEDARSACVVAEF